MADQMLQPGQSMRPVMTLEKACHLVETLYGLQVTSITELDSYTDRNYKVTVDSENRYPYAAKLWPHGYILKVLNTLDSAKKHVEAEFEAQQLLLTSGIKCPQAVLNLSGHKWSLQKIDQKSEGTEQGTIEQVGKDQTCSMHIVYLLTFIPGQIMHELDTNPLLLQNAGFFLAKIVNALKDFSHPALTSHQTLWNLEATPEQACVLYTVQEPEQRSMIEAILKAFSANVLPNLKQFQKGVIHGDYNDQNILVTRDPNNVDAHQITAIIDFGEMADSYYIFEVAVALMHMTVNCNSLDPITVGGHFLAGYLQARPLCEAEWSVLKECVAARYCQCLVMGAYYYSLDPDNEYLLGVTRAEWKQLKELWETSKRQLYGKWFDIVKNTQPGIDLPGLEDITIP